MPARAIWSIRMHENLSHWPHANDDEVLLITWNMWSTLLSLEHYCYRSLLTRLVVVVVVVVVVVSDTIFTEWA
jgi:hypothetical protein